MLQKKHSPFTYQRIGVLIFLLLNCFLTTVPFVKASTENSQYVLTAGLPSQPGSFQDSEEDSHSRYPDEEQQYQIVVRSKQRVVHVLNITRPYAALSKNNFNDSALYHSFASSLVVVRPAYYAFLSLYTLV